MTRWDADYHSRREEAENAVAAPAISLMITGGLGIGLGVLGFVLDAGLLVFYLNKSRSAQLPPTLVRMAGDVVFMLWGLVVLLGAFKFHRLESYGLAMTSAIVAMLPCNFCCALGLPLGIWALVVLNKPEVKGAFKG